MSHHNAGGSRCDWRTPERILAPVRELFGGVIGLDPATAPDNPTRALAFYTADDDGLAQPWDAAPSIFLNPPWSRKLGMKVDPWLERAFNVSMANRTIDIVLLTPASTNAAWFHRFLSPADAHCFPQGRVEYDEAPGVDGSETGVTFDSVVTYFGRRAEAFREAFWHIGWIPGSF